MATTTRPTNEELLNEATANLLDASLKALTAKTRKEKREADADVDFWSSKTAYYYSQKKAAE